MAMESPTNTIVKTEGGGTALEPVTLPKTSGGGDGGEPSSAECSGIANTLGFLR